MVAEAPKLAHQQQWLRKPAHGASGSFSLALKAIPTLCLTVAPGCPNPSAGCLSVQQCAASAAAAQTFTFHADPTKPGAHTIRTADGKCLDIFSHGLIDGAALEVHCTPSQIYSLCFVACSELTD